MRTRAWAMKTLNTQLGSWTQLRHATVLHVKQSYTGGTLCEYPAGYVEPVPPFWQCLERMVTRAADLIEQTFFPDRDLVRKPAEEWAEKSLVGRPPEQRLDLERAWGLVVNPRATQERAVPFLRNFADKVRVLKEIAAKEVRREALSPDELRFLRDVIQIKNESGGPYYNGWYPQLFYKGPKESGKADPLVTDVHTALPDPVTGDPGCVLYEAVADVDLLLIAVDSGEERMMYGGPVFSHYEFETPAGTRLTDTEWNKEVRQDRLPRRPDWTRGYLVPGTPPRPGLFD
jgi:hypothetical protein